MKREIIRFAVESKNGIITNIGRSIITQPAVIFGDGSVKWFDDTKLLKTNKEKEKCYNE